MRSHGTRLNEYIAAGFFLSRHTGERDCTGLELRRVTLAHDHSQRRFFPESWTLSWCRESREERIERAAVFGIAEPDLDRVIAWADQSFGSLFGAWDVLFTVDAARDAARAFLKRAADLELWGVGLHQSVVAEFCKNSAPPAQVPGYAPTGASGLHTVTCLHRASLPDGGTVLGHEILIPDLGVSFNSPESRHLDEQRVLRSAGVVSNPLGLIDSFEEALSCCRFLDAHASETPHQITGWLPWLIVRYPV